MSSDASTPLILGIETSCDETAAAVVRGGVEVLSNVIATQHELHEEYLGVVPEIASRAHLERLLPVLRKAMNCAGVEWRELDAIAVGHRPGLIGSLLVGVSAAKALAWSLDKPLLGVDHIVAHLQGGLLNEDPATYPAMGLVVSGGHTSLFHLTGPTDIRLLGRTIDDAIGEAYDKAAALLHLGYPGGPKLDELAADGDEHAVKLPVADLGRDRLDYSFSGLKTALLYAVRGRPTGHGKSADFERDSRDLSEQQRADFAASFQRAAVTAILRNLNRALDQHNVFSLLVGGGVSANSKLRKELQHIAVDRGLDLRLPPLEYCLDNAAMIAGYAAHRYKAGLFDDLSLTASTQTELTSR